MLFSVLIFLLVLEESRCDEYAAAFAIQGSIFGNIEPEPEPVYSDVEHARKSASAGARGRGRKYSFADLSHLSVQGAPAPAQKSLYRPSNYDNIPTIGACPEVKCHLNLALVLDSSGSVGHENFLTTLEFVKTLLEILTIKASDEGVTVCSGVVSYSTRVHVPVNPCCGNTMCAVVDQFTQSKISYTPGATNTNGALKVARQLLQATSSYKKVAILITDGKSNVGGSPVPFATKMRTEDAIDIVALGVTSSVNEAELKGISGIDLVTKIDYFDQFHELANLLLEANFVSSSYDLTTTFEGICKDDGSTFSKTCDNTSDEAEKCVWGQWSICSKRSGVNCVQTRTCKFGGNAVKQEQRACECSYMELKVANPRFRPGGFHDRGRSRRPRH